MKFLDINGVKTLWSKIKEYISIKTSNYLPLNGGTMLGDIVRKTSDNTHAIYSIGAIANGSFIQCYDCNHVYNTILTGGKIEVFGGGGSATIPSKIVYCYDNIRFTLWPDNITGHIYKFNLQKLIDDGYLIEEVEE